MKLSLTIKRLFFIALIPGAVAAAGYSRQPESRQTNAGQTGRKKLVTKPDILKTIVGTWREVGTGEIFVWAPSETDAQKRRRELEEKRREEELDKQFQGYNAINRLSAEGSIPVDVDGNTMRVKSGEGKILHEITVKGNTMTMKGPDGKTTVWKRVR